MKVALKQNHKRASIILLACTALLISNSAHPTWAENDTNQTNITSIQLHSNGNITNVNKNGQALDPNEVNQKLPVIIITSYTHKGKTVSDPTQFKGAKGTIRIDISIQNQTGTLETLRANINGQEKTKQQVIYTPLSVAATVQLENTTSEQIKKPTETNNAPTTNGIIGTTLNGTPTIQWAEINGVNGKQTSKFTLVYDTENFQPPTFDIAVQPGFGLNPNAEQQKAETQLIAETLEILNSAEKVLDDSGQALDKARSILNDAGSQIGNKTINDLEQSNRRVNENAKKLVATLNKIEAQATQRFKETGSSNLAQLLETTAVVHVLLGDPEQPVPKIQIDPNTCAITEIKNTTNSTTATPKNEELPNVTQVVHGLSARLEALAQASETCKTQLLKDVDNFIGPATPDETTCNGENNLSCINWHYRSNLQNLWKENETKNQAVLKTLNETLNNTSLNFLTPIQEKLNHLNEKTASFNETSNLTELKEQTESIKIQLASAIQKNAENQTKLKALTAQAKEYVESNPQFERTTKLLKQVCFDTKIPSVTSTSPSPLSPAPTISPEISEQKANELAQLIWGQDCPNDETELKTKLAFATPDSIYGAQITQNTAVVTLLQALQSEAEDAPLGILKEQENTLSQIANILTTVDAKLNEKETNLNNKYQEVQTILTETQEKLDSLNTNRKELNTALTEFEKTLITHLNTTKESINSITSENQQQVNSEINSGRNKFETATNNLFTDFSKELQNEAIEQFQNNKLIINHTLGRLEEVSNQQADRIANQTSADIQNIATVTAEGITETDVISQLLAEDIKRVLFDIGTNENRGTGLLGAVATSNAHLTLADNKMIDSTKQLQHSKNNHQNAQTDEIFKDAATRTTISRLENWKPFPNTNDDSPNLGWYSFHLSDTPASK